MRENLFSFKAGCLLRNELYKVKGRKEDNKRYRKTGRLSDMYKEQGTKRVKFIT